MPRQIGLSGILTDLTVSSAHMCIGSWFQALEPTTANARLRVRGGDYKVATSNGSESLSAADGCDWSTEVSDVRRCQSMQRLVCQKTQLELYALWDLKPCVLDVVVLLGIND